MLDFRKFTAGYKVDDFRIVDRTCKLPAHSSKDGVKNFNSWQGVNQ